MIDPVGETRWDADPFGRHELRLFTDGHWTERVRDGALDGIDPPEPTKPVAAAPILDAPEPIEFRSNGVPRLIALAIVVVAILVLLVAINVFV